VADEDVPLPEPVLGLEEGHRGLHIAKVVRVFGVPELGWWGVGARLGVVRVRAESVADCCEGSNVRQGAGGVGGLRVEDARGGGEEVSRVLGRVAPAAAVDEAVVLRLESACEEELDGWDLRWSGRTLPSSLCPRHEVSGSPRRFGDCGLQIGRFLGTLEAVGQALSGFGFGFDEYNPL
jgi:hypothetical protein